jgi:hypothetical protein
MKMEPNKLEKDFKKKLEQRTIQPSDMAWDRLDAMLSVTEKKKPNRAWMYMAASFLALLLVGSLFLKQEKENQGTTIKKDAVVTQEQPAQIKAANETTTGTKEIQDALFTGKNEVATVQAPAKQQINTATARHTRKTNVTSPIITQDAVAVIEKKATANTVTANEADKLLAVSIADDSAKKKPSIKVDANSLLSSVEGELDESYRSKAFQGVVKNFNAVKTAVANRNYQ